MAEVLKHGFEELSRLEVLVFKAYEVNNLQKNDEAAMWLFAKENMVTALELFHQTHTALSKRDS